jgi:8-oxo-dGTP diphosphatase
MQQLTRFNVRVYGILINEHQQVLLADEAFKSATKYTKYPGGGLELGEGAHDCLKREFKEETGIDVQVKEHFYTTDFFVLSAFDNNSQIISIYYLVESKEWQKIKASTKKFDFNVTPGEEVESFRWVSVHDLSKEDALLLPIDLVVTRMLIRQFSKLV